MKNVIYSLSSTSGVFILSSNPNANSLKSDLKFTLLLCFFLISGFSCTDGQQSLGYELAPCDPQKETIKEVTDQVGRIGYSEKEEKWLIIVSLPSTYDSQDIGIVCNDLPEKFQEVGKKIQFSGEYKKCDECKGVLPGQTYYYLYISEINTSED